MFELDEEIFKIDCIEKHKALKEKYFKKLDTLVNYASSLMDVSKNIYSDNNNLRLSPQNKMEPVLKETIKYNEYLGNKEKKEISLNNEDIIKEYNKMTGISISRTDKLNLKINFDFLGEKNEYYIVLSFHDLLFNVEEICPKEIDYKHYIDEYCQTKDITLFLCKLINYELIPHYKKRQNK